MSWHLSGTYVENCNCDVVCPCGGSGFALPADNDRCVVLLAFHIDDGEIDGTDVGDLGLAILADTPGQMTDGNWRIGALIDDRATEEQANLLLGVFGGHMGGPMEHFAPLIGEVVGHDTAAFTWVENDHHHSLRIGDAVDLETEDFVLEGATEPLRMTGVAHPANSTLALGRAVRSRIAAFGISLDGTGKNAHSTSFAWSGP